VINRLKKNKHKLKYKHKKMYKYIFFKYNHIFELIMCAVYAFCTEIMLQI